MIHVRVTRRSSMMLLPLRPPNRDDAEEPHQDAACEETVTGMILAAAYTPGEFTACRVDARHSLAGNPIPGLGVPRVQVQEAWHDVARAKGR